MLAPPLQPFSSHALPHPTPNDAGRTIYTTCLRIYGCQVYRGCQHTRNMLALTKAYSLKLVLRISFTPKTSDQKPMYTTNESPKSRYNQSAAVQVPEQRSLQIAHLHNGPNAVNRKFDLITLTLTLLDPLNLLSRKKWVMLHSCIINAIHIFLYIRKTDHYYQSIILTEGLLSVISA